jgi:hypothetical protein
MALKKTAKKPVTKNISSKGDSSKHNDLLTQLAQFPTLQALAEELDRLSKFPSEKESIVEQKEPESPPKSCTYFVYPSIDGKYFFVIAVSRESSDWKIINYDCLEHLKMALDFFMKDKSSEFRYFSRSGEVLTGCSLAGMTEYPDERYVRKTVSFSEISPGKYFVLSPNYYGRLDPTVIHTDDPEKILREILKTYHWRGKSMFSFSTCYFEVYNSKRVLVTSQVWEFRSTGRWQMTKERDLSHPCDQSKPPYARETGSTLVIHWERSHKEIPTVQFTENRASFYNNTSWKMDDPAVVVEYLNEYHLEGHPFKAIVYVFDYGILISTENYERRHYGWAPSGKNPF